MKYRVLLPVRVPTPSPEAEWRVPVNYGTALVSIDRRSINVSAVLTQ